MSKATVADKLEHHHPPLSLALPAPPLPTLVARTAEFPAKPTLFFAPTLDEDALIPDDVLLVTRIGFRGAVNLGCGMVLGSKLDVLRKDVEEILCFLLKEGASVSTSTPDTPFRIPSGSDTTMGIGMGNGTFSAPFATGRTLILVGPEALTFFFLATG